MVPAEILRIVLIIGLAATTYMMVLAWNDDYGPQSSVEISAAPELNGPSVAPPDEGTIDTPPAPSVIETPPSVADTGSDVPDASLLAGPETAVQQVGNETQPAAQQRLVRVETDTLHMWIDLTGGDIVRVQLPEHKLSSDQPDVPFLLLDRGSGHTYVAQSGLWGKTGLDGQSRPVFESAQSEYRMTGDSLVVELTTSVGDYHAVKSFSFSRGSYLVDLNYRIDNRSSEPFQSRLFAQIKRDTNEPYGSSSFTLGPQPYLGGALTTVDNRYEKLEFEDLDEGVFRARVEGGWIAMLQHYFLSAWIPDADASNDFYGRKRNDGTYDFGVNTPEKIIAPGATGDYHIQFYAGPKDQKVLEQISPNLNLTVDYGFLWWLAVPLFYVLDWFYEQVGNWGVAIILLTVLVKALLYPLSAASFKSMANMKRVAPQLKRLQERYADDRQKLSQEMMALYKKENVNPLGGCLPMLLPMPIFLALYWVLFESVELRHAPFFLWINDLAAMDPFFVLPILMGATMYGQQLLSPAMGDPMQVRMMKMMPIMFTVLFLFFPAGLVLYWFVNSLLSVAQQWYVTNKVVGASA